MSSGTTTQNLIKIIKVLMFLILLMPLIVVPKSFFPFIFWKIIVFRVLVEILLVVYILLLFENKAYLPARSCLFWSLIIFLAVLIIATLTSLNPYHSFWSNQERMEGLLTMLHFMALFLILIAVFKKKKDWYWFFKISLGVSLTASVYALLQKIGVSWSWVIFGDVRRFSSTIGNPAFFAAYLMPHIFLSGFLAWRTKSWQWRLFYIGTSFFELVVVYWTATRGALLGLITAIFFLLVFLLFQRTKQTLKIVCLSLILLSFLAGGLVYKYRDAVWFDKVFGFGLYRLSHSSFDISSADRSRFLSWQIAWQAWKQKSILGWGPENYVLAFNANFNPEFFTLESETWFDRAHNKLLDIAVEAGALGFLSYLAIFVCLVFLLVRYWLGKKRQDWAAPLFLALFIAYFVQNIFVFDTPATYLIFFLLLGFVHIYTSQPINAENREGQLMPGASSGQSQVGSRRKNIFLAGLLIVILLVMIKVNFKPAAANYHLAMVSYSQDTETILHHFQRAMFMKTFVQAEARKEFSKQLSEAADRLTSQKQSLAKVEPLVKLGIAQLEQSIKLYPQDPSHYIYLGHLYNLLLVHNPDATMAKRGQKILEHAQKICSQRPEIYLELASSYVITRQYNGAINTYQHLLDFIPDLALAHWRLGVTLDLSGDKKAGLEEMAVAYNLNYFIWGQHTDDLLILAKAYADSGQYQETIKTYREYLALRPQDIQVLASLAAAYGQLGEYALAQETARKILEINPESAVQVEKFLQGFDAGKN